MPASHFEFHVEEVSMEAFLAAWLPRFLPRNCTFGIYPYPGKPALLRKIGNRLRGYANWMPAEYRFVVVVDRDRDDCKELKSRLEQICDHAGLQSRRTAGGPDWQIVTRIAIEELEAWFFGDWPAVRAAYPRVSANIPGGAARQDPDAIPGGTWETFERVLQRYGYFKQGLAKVKAATDIGRHINPAHNRSHSFAAFRDAVGEAVARKSPRP